MRPIHIKYIVPICVSRGQLEYIPCVYGLSYGFSCARASEHRVLPDCQLTALNAVIWNTWRYANGLLPSIQLLSIHTHIFIRPKFYSVYTHTTVPTTAKHSCSFSPSLSLFISLLQFCIHEIFYTINVYVCMLSVNITLRIRNNCYRHALSTCMLQLCKL